MEHKSDTRTITTSEVDKSCLALEEVRSVRASFDFQVARGGWPREAIARDHRQAVRFLGFETLALATFSFDRRMSHD